MIQLSQAASDDDQTNEIKSMVGRMFDDLDVDGDGKLTFEEYKLSVMKEPLIVDFLERFLAEHNISQHPRVPSRPASVSSYRSGRSLSHPHHSKLSSSGLPPSSSPIHSASRLSVRVSQAELLDYGHHHHSPTSGSSPTSSPKYNNHNNNNGSPSIGPRSPHHLSRPTSMTSLDAALSTMDLNHVDDSNNKHLVQNGSKSTRTTDNPTINSTTSKSSNHICP
ncbi:hypothetical protein BC941DRAFT_418831 [Chlamydoabsidia padenii]|nr:hypothetical protein BC941DRAFT_418831 [Chlamydoabsidia padenii]